MMRAVCPKNPLWLNRAGKSSALVSRRQEGMGAGDVSCSIAANTRVRELYGTWLEWFSSSNRSHCSDVWEKGERFVFDGRRTDVGVSDLSQEELL